MTENEREGMIRQYAAGEITWHAMQERGFDSFVDVLAGLGALGLRQPVVTARRCSVQNSKLTHIDAVYRKGAFVNISCLDIASS